MTAAVETQETQATETETQETKPTETRIVRSTAQKLVGTRYATFIGPSGSFQPGHDAKAKSQMLRDATSGDAALAAEAEAALDRMGWSHFLQAKRDQLAKGPAPKARKPKAEKAEKAGGDGAATGATATPARERSADDTLSGFHTRRGKSGYFVMNGPDQGVEKYNTQEEADEVVGMLTAGIVTIEQVKGAEDVAALRALVTASAIPATEGEAEPGEAVSE